MSLLRETKALARAYRAEADRLDELWLKTADPRAVQGGDTCEDADFYRRQAYRLFDLARELEESGI